MKFKELLSQLESNPQRELVFEYSPNCFVGANYHITEVKQINIASVDCGGNEDQWQESVIQLWESPMEVNKTEFMKVDKALSILNTVNKKQALRLADEVKFEYSNAHFHTAVLAVKQVKEIDGRLVISLQVEATLCKAPDQCCPPKIKETLAENVAACAPGSGCC